MSSLNTALITGAAQKTGRAIAELLLDHGYQLMLHAHSSIDDLKSWVAKHDKGFNVLAIIEADLSQTSGQEHLINCAQNFSLDLLVNNASAFEPKPFSKISRTEFEKMQTLNLMAPYFIIQGLLPKFKKGSSVVNIIDAMWERPLPGFSHYAISKAGLAILTRTLAVELSGQVRINGVAPGLLAFQHFFNDAQKQSLLNKIPSHKPGSFSDIAEAVLFLHEKAPYAVGEILTIDGGRSVA